MAVAVGFEPTVPRGTTVFKTAAINQTLPRYHKNRSRDILRGLPASSTGLCLNRSGTIIIIVKAVI